MNNWTAKARFWLSLLSFWHTFEVYLLWTYFCRHKDFILLKTKRFHRPLSLKNQLKKYSKKVLRRTLLKTLPTYTSSIFLLDKVRLIILPDKAFHSFLFVGSHCLTLPLPSCVLLWPGREWQLLSTKKLLNGLLPDMGDTELIYKSN